MILLRKTFTQWDATDNLKRMKDADILAESKKPTSNYGEAAKAGLVGAATIGGIRSAVGAGLAAKNGTGIMKGLSRGGKLGAIAGGLTALITGSVKEYANLEQSVGGVETLFKDSADKVIANAEKAYKTAGIDANKYMEQVTSFSASLLQSLGGDTKKAADYADQAIVDMADNSNKFGTDMELIQNAYQGFAKSNYTMLDNLKLG